MQEQHNEGRVKRQDLQNGGKETRGMHTQAYPHAHNACTITECITLLPLARTENQSLGSRDTLQAPLSVAVS